MFCGFIATGKLSFVYSVTGSLELLTDIIVLYLVGRC